MATRCCSPPESVSVRCQARVEQAHVVEAPQRDVALGGRRSTRASAAHRRQPRTCGRRPTRTLSITRRRFTRLNCW